MPILVKDYVWTQSTKVINIRVPISRVSHEKVDVFTTDGYVKANFSPFLFEVFLLYEIDSKKSSCVVKEDLIAFELVKKEEKEWESLEKELTKAEKMKVKTEYMQKYQDEFQAEKEEKRIRKTQLDRHAVQRAMDVDSREHALMDKRRDEERNKAMNALEEWRLNTNEKEPTRTTRRVRCSNYQMPSLIEMEPSVKITELDSSSDEETKESKQPFGKRTIDEETKDSENTKEFKKPDEKPKLDKETKESEDTEECKKPAEKPKDVEETKECKKPKEVKNSKPYVPPIRRPPVKTPVKSEYIEKKKEELSKRVLPQMRTTAEIEITHTPRTFPTPSRESTADEEAAWLKNITLARRATGFVSEDLRPEEQDPQWCKDKGDEFFKSGNFLGAISAYSHGISLSDKLPSLYANRSVTHFALGNFHKCMEDCSSAIDLMKPACEGNRRSRAKCIARRAAALARIGFLHKAIDEMKAAAKLLPEDEKIKNDIHDMERAWEQNPDDN